MQLSEEQLDKLWDECACEDGSIPFVSRRPFVEKVLRLRSQADARPFAWALVDGDTEKALGLYKEQQECDLQAKAFVGDVRKTALYTHPEASAQGLSDEARTAVRDAVAQALGDAYDCTRVWGAWNVGTMSQDDFVMVAEDENRVAEIADAAIGALTRASAATATPSSVRKALQYALSELGKPPFGGVVDCTPIMQALIDTGSIDMNASAATVAEPRAWCAEHQSMCPTHPAAQQQADAWVEKHGFKPFEFKDAPPEAAQIVDQHFWELTGEQQAKPGADERAAWEYSFIHSSATGRRDEKVGPCLTYDKDQAFGVGCIEQRAVRVSAAQSGQRAGVAENDPYCPRCNGYGEETVMSNNGPDAEELTIACQHCGGEGSLAEAYKGVAKLLAEEQKKYLEACGKLWFERHGNARQGAVVAEEWKLARRMAELNRKLSEPEWHIESIREFQRELRELEDRALAAPTQQQEGKS